ncbi:hypothetical protein L1987_61972 [Smallanthus sonchifolius]|uniref:Uncharacterized protein n=1 Tax=Smallanthus sonchifolius TaxID=185202 RepID=A0ACB9C966_9ASTR|nr:hypothetical protein L1987_61972 [Smallanthus sonchifolius]
MQCKRSQVCFVEMHFLINEILLAKFKGFMVRLGQMKLIENCRFELVCCFTEIQLVWYVRMSIGSYRSKQTLHSLGLSQQKNHAKQ